MMVTSPEGKHYYLGFSDWDAAHEWQAKQAKAAQQIVLLRTLLGFALLVVLYLGGAIFGERASSAEGC